MSHLRAISTAAIALLPACGIVTITHPGDEKAAAEKADEGPETQEQAEDRLDRQYFGESSKLLDQADAALTAGDADKALEAATQGRKKIDQEYRAESSHSVVVTDALSRVENLAIMLQGTAAHAAGKDLEALIDLGRSKYDSRGCPLAIRKRCADHAEWLASTFPNVIHSSGYVEISTTSGPFSRELDTLLMAVFDREIKPKKGYVAIGIEETSHKDAGKGRAVVRIDGKTTHDSYEECNKIGTARIGGTDFDVSRCHQHGFVAPRANLVVDVPAEDITELTDQPGELAVIMFDAKDWKHAGNTWTIKNARVVYVSPAPSR
jgi:hypothetical protein